MLHRRPTGSGNSSTLPPRSTASTSTPTKNTAYTPLRRPSANLYPGTSNGSTYGGAPGAGSGAKYTLPSLSPGYSGINLTPQPSTGAGGGSAYAPAQGYFQNGNAGGGGLGVFDLGDEPSKAKSWSEWSVEDVMATTRGGLEKFRRGLEDALRLDRSFSLVWSDRELRTLIIKSTVINLLSLLLLSFTPFIFSAASLSNDALARTKSVGLWYNLLLSWPVFVVCFWVNATWAPDISRRAHTLLHPAYRNQPPSNAPSTSFSKDDLIAKVFNSIQRILLISDFTLVSRLIMLIPLLGRPLAFGYMCIIDSYYCFDSTFTAKGWTLNRRILFMQERTGYMIGFGLAATFITSFGPPLVNMAVFALIYPFFVIQAQLARPPVPRHSLLPSTPSPQSSLPPSPSGVQSSNNPFLAPPTTSVEDIRAGNFQIRVPIFFFATLALMGLRWLEAAIGRDRGERRGGMGFKERPGKRLG